MLTTTSVPQSAVAARPLSTPAPGLIRSAALSRLLREVASTGYRFITPSPFTHQRVLANRAQQNATSWRDIFGWSMPFAATAIEQSMLDLMDQAGVLAVDGELLRSLVRISSIGDDLFVHSAYPTTQDNAVFFGPDTYRFARFIRQALAISAGWIEPALSLVAGTPMHILDVGCGSGAGALIAVRALSAANIPLAVTMNDINPLALRYALVNADIAGIAVNIALGDALSCLNGRFDLIVCNPPYLDDDAQRAYRHGGARLGRALSVRMATEAIARLALGGRLLLYTGVAIVEGDDPFLAEIGPVLDAAGCDWSYGEIDPDVFGEEIERPVYAHVDRIAAVGLIAQRKREPA
ncbi:class I SAM-dependent methyltransferase [Actimicrobium antarcticum]|uniref:Class I SAM-dependent methyltransferase n=1 Tax=Actimicrobium antarcticum TaxID=1051899 RepID=A0ABP7TIH2_9BURK